VVTRVQAPRLPRALVTAGVVAGLCVLGYDGVRIAQIRFGTSDDAQMIALDAAGSYHSRPDRAATCALAEAAAAARGASITPTECDVAGDGTVSLILRRSTTTLVLGRVEKTWEMSSATGSATWLP